MAQNKADTDTGTNGLSPQEDAVLQHVKSQIAYAREHQDRLEAIIDRVYQASDVEEILRLQSELQELQLEALEVQIGVAPHRTVN